MTETSASLLERLRLRDPDALTVIFNQYADKIYRLAVSILHDDVQADGVVQNTFLTLIERIDQFEGRSHISTWMYRIAYNECMGRVRKQRNHANVDLDPALDDDLVPTAFIDWRTLPDSAFSTAEAMTEMQSAIDKLSPSLRATFILRDIDELSTAEAAHVLDISEAAVKVRLHRARLMLREHLAHYFEEYTAR